MLVLVVRFEVKPDRLAEFDALVDATLDGIRTLEPGTVVYLAGVPDDSPTSRAFVEVYADEEAFEAHEVTSHTQRFLAERADLLESYRVEILRQPTGVLPALRSPSPGP